MKTLFDQTKINNLDLKNRLVRSATWEKMADSTGHITPRLIRLYQDLAEGGVGLIISSAVSIAADDTTLPGMLGIYDDSFIPEYQQLTMQVHQNGSAILLQAGFAGKNGQMWAPSNPSRDQLQAIVWAFGECARRAKQGGFDGIQIHAAHGYFLSQFLNAQQNTRTDEYGGALANRIRLLEQIVVAIREQTGQDFNIFIKINAINFWGDTETFQTCKAVCAQLANWGIQGIEISGSTGQNTDQKRSPSYKESIFRDYAAEIAGIVDVPVILVGFNRTSAVLTEILNNTSIVYFAFSRPLIRQPDLANIWRQDINATVECISCNQCFPTDGRSCVLHTK